MKLYSMPSSGNSYKIRLLLSLLDLPCHIVDCEDATPEIAQARADGRLPFGKVPVLELDSGRLLPESNAILLYLAQGSGLIPADPFDHAQMMAWMFWEQNQHEGVIAVRAALRMYPSRAHLVTPERLAELLDRGNQLLGIMERRLSDHDWLVGRAMTAADICLYAYTHTADERGGYDLSRFPGIKAWCARISALPDYKGLFA